VATSANANDEPQPLPASAAKKPRAKKAKIAPTVVQTNKADMPQQFSADQVKVLQKVATWATMVLDAK